MNLKLLDYQPFIEIKRSNGRVEIKDPVRNKYLALTPEEHVRQLFIQYLIRSKGYSKNRLSIEREIHYNQRQKRFDLLIYDQAMQPYMLVECKAPRVKLKQDTSEQISSYNQGLRVPYLCMTNGQETLVFKMDYQIHQAQLLAEFPDAL